LGIIFLKKKNFAEKFFWDNFGELIFSRNKKAENPKAKVRGEKIGHINIL
jgi:hypothetical protein